MKTGQNCSRIWEIDFFRGIALAIMVYWHILFDMKEFYGYNVNYESVFNQVLGKISVILFILISGISCSFSRSNTKRGLRILGMALAITLVSYLYNPGYCIKFGILHFLGTSILIYPVFRRINKYALPAIGAAIIILGYFFARINPPHNYFFIFGITNSKFSSADYYPIAPWFGVFLYGVALGKIIYAQKRSIINFPVKENILNIIGRHTLPIYILHQPVILAVLEFVKRITAMS